MNAALVDTDLLYQMENNLLSTKRVRGSWSSTITTYVVGGLLIAMVAGFLVAQYNEGVRLKAVETSKKNIPPTSFAWNNPVRNLVL